MTAATIPTTRRRCPVWLLGALILLIAIPALNAHAVSRHGRTARSAHRYISNYECEPDCERDGRLHVGIQENGRTQVVLELPRIPGTPTTWAVMIVGAGFLVTCFLSQSRRSVEKTKERCH